MGKVETFMFGELFEHSDANFHCLIMETPIIIGERSRVWVLLFLVRSLPIVQTCFS